MAKVKKIVDGVVVEVDDNTMVKVIENGVVVEKPANEVNFQEQPSEPSPEKKSPIGTPSQGGLQGSQDTPPSASSDRKVPAMPLAGLGGVETPAQTFANNIIQESLNPKKQEGTYVLDGKKISKEQANQFIHQKSFVEAWKQNPQKLQIYNDYALQQIGNRQIKSLDNPDWMDSLAAGAADALKMGAGAAEYMNDLLSDITKVPNLLYGVMGAASGAEGLAQGLRGDTKERVQGAMQKFAEDAEYLRNQRFQFEGDFVDQVGKAWETGKVEDIAAVANTAINTTAESAVPSLLIGLGTAVTGGGAGMAAIAKGGAAVTPLFIGGEYADQKIQMKDIQERLNDSQKFLSTSEIPTRDEIALINLSKAGQYIRPAVRGTAEMAGEVVSAGIWKGSLNLFTQSMKSLVGRTATEIGQDVAEEVATVSSKELVKRMFESMGVDPLKEGFSELGTFAGQELTDVLLGVSTKSPDRILREGLNAWALGAASGGVMTSPGAAGTGIMLTGRGLTNAKKYLDNIIAFDSQGLNELNEVVRTMEERGQVQQAESIKENISKREKAVKAVPKEKVADTETVDTVEEIQALEESKKGLLPVYQEPIQEEINAKVEKLKSDVKKEYPAPTVNTTPTESNYASVNRNDGKGTIDLTQEEYLAEMERRGTPVEIPSVDFSLPKMTLRANNPFDESLKKLGWADADIAKMTIEQKQELVVNKKEAPVVESSSKVDAVKENAKQERLAEMQRGLDDDAEGTPSNKQTQAEPVNKVETEVVSESELNKDVVSEMTANQVEKELSSYSKNEIEGVLKKVGKTLNKKRAKINTEEKSAITSGGKQIKFKTTEEIDEELGERFIKIRAIDNNGKPISYARFIKRDDKKIEGLEVETIPSERFNGVASAIYSYADALGYDLKKSPLQTSEGRALWDSLERKPTSLKEISEAYHKAKNDGLNDDLVKEIDKLLLPENSKGASVVEVAPTETVEVAPAEERVPSMPNQIPMTKLTKEGEYDTEDPFTYQQLKGERLIQKSETENGVAKWDDNSLLVRERIENAGDILRELALRGPSADRNYLYEKINKLKGYFDKLKGRDLLADDRPFGAMNRNEELFRELRRAWYKQPTSDDAQAAVRRLVLELVDGNSDGASLNRVLDNVVSEIEKIVPVRQENVSEEVQQLTPPTDAVQKPSTEEKTMGDKPETREGVRGQDTQGQETTQEGETKEEVVAESKIRSREEIQKELDGLRKEYDRRTEDFESVDDILPRIGELNDFLVQDMESNPQEFTDEEIAIAYEEQKQALAELDSKDYKSRQIHEMFRPIPMSEYTAMGDKNSLKGVERFTKGLIDKNLNYNVIEDMAMEMSEAAGIEITEADIIDYVNDRIADRVKGVDTFKFKDENSAKRPKSKPKKKPSSAKKEQLLAERQAIIDKIKNSLNNRGFAFDPKNEGRASATLLNDLVKWAQIEFQLGAITAQEFIDKVVGEKGYAWRGPARRAFTIAKQTMPDVPFAEVQEKVKTLRKAAEAEIREAIKETRKEEKAKADEKVAKAKEQAEKKAEKAKVAAEKRVEKAKDETKQKYVNIGYRIGEAFGKLGGEIRGKAEGRKEGRKEAGTLQKDFAKQVEEIVLTAINEAKIKSPGFTVSANQLAAATKKLLSVNFNSPLSIEKAVEYVDKVLNNATYANDVSRVKKLKAVSKKRLDRNDFGIDNGAMRQALKVEHEQLSPEELADYMEFVSRISSGPYNKARNIADVEKYAELYRQQKEEAQEPVSEAQEEANQSRGMSRNAAKQEAIDEFQFERLSMSAPVSEAYQKDYALLRSLTEEELDSLSEKQLRELSNAIRNMRDDIGFMSGNASNTIREIRAERIAKEGQRITEGRDFKQLLRDMILPMKISFKGVQKMTPSDKMKRLISMMPLNRIDAAIKGFTGQSIHDTFIQPISTSFSVFSEKMTQLDKGYDRLYSKVGKSLIPWKREEQRQDEMVKLSLIAIQKEYEANPNNEEVSPLSDYMDAIREAAVVNDDYAGFAEKYIAIYESMLDGDGNFDYAKQEELLDPDTKAFYDYTQAVNAENTPFVEVSAIRNGENVSLRQSYTPISVALIDYSNLSEVQNMANKFSGDENVKPTAQSGNIKKRTKGGKPLYLDFHRNAKKATRSVLLDYYMREPLRVASKAFNKIAKNPEVSPQSRAFFKGVEANVAQVVKNTFVNEYYEGGIGTMIAEVLKKRGYQMALASIPRAGVEFASNLTHAVINKPKELAEGTRILSKYKGDDEDLRTLAIYAESAQISRMFERSMSIMSEQGSNTKGSSSAYGRAIDQAADAIMSTPDRVIARPVWLGSFSRTFEQVSGSPLDIQEMISSPEYRQNNAAAIASARNVADVNLSQGFASMNPFEGVVASQVTKADGWADTFDKYMTRFMRYEFQSAADALNGLAGRNELSKTQASALLAATMLRMAAYQFAMSYAIDGFYSLVEAATGTGPDDEEEDNEELTQEVGSALAGAVISMLVFRRLGNWAKAPIAWGIETLNSKFGEEAGLRNGDYDPYKNSLVFSPIAGDIQGYDMTASKMIPKFMGPYGPMTKTAFRASELLGRTGIQDGMGGYIIKPSLKSQDAIDKANRELAVRIVPELFMQSIGAPVPRDIRNLIIRDVFKDFQENKPSADSSIEKAKEEVEAKSNSFIKATLLDIGKKQGDNFISQGKVGVTKRELQENGTTALKVAEKHNVSVFKEKYKSEKYLLQAFITANGTGESFSDPKDLAKDYLNISKESISSEHKEIIKDALSHKDGESVREYMKDFERAFDEYKKRIEEK